MLTKEEIAEVKATNFTNYSPEEVEHLVGKEVYFAVLDELGDVLWEVPAYVAGIDPFIGLTLAAAAATEEFKLHEWLVCCFGPLAPPKSDGGTWRWQSQDPTVTFDDVVAQFQEHFASSFNRAVEDLLTGNIIERQLGDSDSSDGNPCPFRP